MLSSHQYSFSIFLFYLQGSKLSFFQVAQLHPQKLPIGVVYRNQYIFGLHAEIWGSPRLPATPNFEPRLVYDPTHSRGSVRKIYPYRGKHTNNWNTCVPISFRQVWDLKTILSNLSNILHRIILFYQGVLQNEPCNLKSYICPLYFHLSWKFGQGQHNAH